MNVPWQISIFRSLPTLRKLIEFRGYEIIENNDLRDIDQYFEFYKIPLKAPKQQSVTTDDDESVPNETVATSKKGQGVYPVPIFRCRHKSDHSMYLTVYYHMYTPSLSAQDFKLYVETFTGSQTDQETVMIILQGSPEKQKRSSYTVPSNVYLQLFCVQSLMYNVMDHMDVPMHRIVSEEEVETFVKKHHFTLRKEEFSKLLSSDPIAMFIGLMPGEICRIDRPSASTGTEVVFRVCI